MTERIEDLIDIAPEVLGSTNARRSKIKKATSSTQVSKALEREIRKAFRFVRWETGDGT
jgi:hypothetical protein